jgi:xylulose-5-phosphate/fructose-6-phosphate phosphoketolase
LIPSCWGRDRQNAESGSRAAYVKQFLRDKLIDNKVYIEKYGEDMPEILIWNWQDE